MGIIPVLNNKQIDRFRALLASHQKIDLTTSSGKSPRRLPSYDADDSPSVSSGYGFFAVKDASDENGPAVLIYDSHHPTSAIAGAVNFGNPA